MSAVPVWFLDVDGVVNAFPAPSPRKAYATLFHQAAVPARGADGIERMYEIWYRPAVVDFINAVHRSGRARVCWLTTWGRQAVTKLAPALGFEEFACLDADDGSSPTSVQWWKVRAIHAVVAPTDAFVFTDDSLSRSTRAALRAVYGEGALLVTPHSSPGLMPEHQVRIERFLRGWSGRDGQRLGPAA